MSTARLLCSGRTTNNNVVMREMRNTADPLRQQVFRIEYAQAPQLRSSTVTQYLQPNLHLCLVHDSGLASFANNAFLWLVQRAPLTAETGFSRCRWINVTAMIVWTPRVQCDESSGSHDGTNFATTVVAAWILFLLSALSRWTNLEDLVDVCTVCSVIAYPGPSAS